VRSKLVTANRFRTISLCYAEELQTLVYVLLKRGYLPVHELAIACRTHSLGFLSQTPLSPLEATFWRAVCCTTASMAADVNIFSENDAADVAEEALDALTPDGCEHWGSLLWRQVRTDMHGMNTCHSSSAGSSRGSAGTLTRARDSESDLGTFEGAKEVLTAMVVCVDFCDDANRNAAMDACAALVQETCYIAYASPGACLVGFASCWDEVCTYVGGLV
jgi:hypothetical protein